MKKISFDHFIIISLFLILFIKVDFFKKTFFLITSNYDQRFLKAYNDDYFGGFCSKESQGYIYHIKKKFDLNIPPQIINFSDKRSKIPYWIFYKGKNEINNNNIILLNYNGQKFNFSNYNVRNNYNNKCYFLEKK